MPELHIPRSKDCCCPDRSNTPIGPKFNGPTTAPLKARITLLKQEFRSTLNYAVGGEFEIPKTEVRVRAGYSFKPSAYAGDPSSFGQTTITAGAGICFKTMLCSMSRRCSGRSKHTIIITVMGRSILRAPMKAFRLRTLTSPSLIGFSLPSRLPGRAVSGYDLS